MTITATFDHRTGATHAGGPASRYLRVEHRSVARTTTRPNYAVRRLGALLVAATTVAIALTMAAWAGSSLLAGFGGTPASAADATPASAEAVSAATAMHVARSGDSLWSIADTYRGGVDRDDYVDALVALNGGTVIHVGQAVHLP